MAESLLCCLGRRRRRLARSDYHTASYKEDRLIINKHIDGASLSFSAGAYSPPPIVRPEHGSYSLSDFTLLKTVGRGAYGKVMLAQQLNSVYAVKVVPKAKVVTHKQIDQILAELKILKKVKFPFCIKLHCSFQTDDFFVYVFNFAAGGPINYHLRQVGTFTEDQARFYIGEVILALEYLHGQHIIFRDLKPENCMLSHTGHVILTDFGSAKILEAGEHTNTFSGTPQYMAPEVLKGEDYNFSADWWSCGILLYELLAGKAPFHSSDRVELYRLVLRASLRFNSCFSPRARNLLVKMINRDPLERLGHQRPSDIKEHPFFSKAEITAEEERYYMMLEEDRIKQQEAIERVTKITMPALSRATKRLTLRFSRSYVFAGSSNTWLWEELASQLVDPPYRPNLRSIVDVQYFDTAVTCIPATLSDLVTTTRALHLQEFDYVPEQYDPGNSVRSIDLENN